MIKKNDFKILWSKWSDNFCRNKLTGEIRRYKIVGEWVKVY